MHSGPLSVPLYLLAGTAFELFLKAGITLASGKYRKQWLRDIVRHDLKRALKEAQSAGFNPEIDKLQFAVSYLSKPYSQHFFRYESPGKFNVPDMRLTLSVLDQLERELVTRYRLTLG